MSTIVTAIDNENLLTLKMMVAIQGMVPLKEVNHGLMYSVKTGFVEATKVLLEAGAEINMSDSRGMTPLMQACQSGHTEVVETLLQAGSPLNTASTSGSTALHLACMHGRASVVQALVQAGANLNRQDDFGRSPLSLCASSRQTLCMKTLLAVGCDIDLKDNSGHTALHHACQKAVGVDLLLDAGADSDSRDPDGNTPLMVAATEGFDNVVKSLCKHKANPDIQNSFGFAPIHYLAMKNHWKGIQYVARAGGDLNPLDKSLKLPLWHAVDHNRHQAVKTLLRANCLTDPTISTASGDNIPLKAALDKELFGLAKLLVLAGCKLPALHQWIHNHNADKQRRADQRSQRVRLYIDSDEESDSEDEYLGQEEAYNWFQEWLHSAHSLRQLCRIALRRYMGHGVLRKAEDLPVPQQMRDYITLREVEDHHH